MTADELEAVVDGQAASWRGLVKPQLRRLATGLRPGEQVLALAIALRSRLVYGLCVVAATDQRVILLWTAPKTEEHAYDALTSVSYDADTGEIWLVTPGACARSGSARSSLPRRSSRPWLRASARTACMRAPGRGRRASLSERSSARR